MPASAPEAILIGNAHHVLDFARLLWDMGAVHISIQLALGRGPGQDIHWDARRPVVVEAPARRRRAS